MDISRFDSRGVIDGSPTLALPYLGDVVSINAPLARYRGHGNSMSAWSNPSVSLLEKELSLFRKSWEEVKPVIGTAYPSEGLEGSLYVLERRLMIACLSGRILNRRFGCSLREAIAPNECTAAAQGHVRRVGGNADLSCSGAAPLLDTHETIFDQPATWYANYNQLRAWRPPRGNLIRYL